MFTAAVFLTVKTWKLPRSPYREQTVVHQTTEYYSVLNGNELSSHKKTRKKLRCKLLTERSQYDSNYIAFWKKTKMIDPVKISSGCKRSEGTEIQTGRARRSFRSVKMFGMLLR